MPSSCRPGQRFGVRILAHEGTTNSLTPIASLADSIQPLIKELRAAEGDKVNATADDVATAVDAIARRSVGLMSFVERYRKVANLPSPALNRFRLILPFRGSIRSCGGP